MQRFLIITPMLLLGISLLDRLATQRGQRPWLASLVALAAGLAIMGGAAPAVGFTGWLLTGVYAGVAFLALGFLASRVHLCVLPGAVAAMILLQQFGILLLHPFPLSRLGALAGAPLVGGLAAAWTRWLAAPAVHQEAGVASGSALLAPAVPGARLPAG